MPKSVVRLDLNHSIYQVLSGFAHAFSFFGLVWPLDISVFYIFVNKMRLRSLEWNRPCQHFEQDVSKCPGVNSKSLGLSVDHLWRLVVHSPDKSVSSRLVATGWELIFILWIFLLVRLIELLVYLSCISKIDDLTVEIRVQHDVLRFHVSMHDTFFLNEFDEVDKLSKHDLYNRLSQLASALLNKLIKTPVLCDFEDKV
jgi:hypothetical protein